MYFLGENEVDIFQFNIIKYVMRHDHKGGRRDLCKAMRYLEMYLRKVYDGDTTWASGSKLPEGFLNDA